MKPDFSVIAQYLPELLLGLRWTVMLCVGSLIIGIGLGLLACLGKLLRCGLLYWIALGYVELFRTLPEMVTIFWVYYCLPLIFHARLSATLSGLIALSLFAGAVLGEIFRAGVEAVPRGQVEAAWALGLPRLALWWRVLLPQAFRIMSPAFLLLVTDLIKVSGLLSAIGVTELVYEAATLSGSNFRYFELFSAVGICYFLLVFPLSMIAQRLELRLARRER